MDDLPSTADEFGAHKRLARTIADLIQSTDGPRKIGLAGRWGSGKSTVVELLRAKLGGEESLLYVFDAWEHRGDPLRRSFLEGLEQACRDTWGEDSVPDGSIIQPDERIEKTVPISTLGFLFLVTILLLPLGFVFISVWLSSQAGPASWGWDSDSWKLLVGLGFSFAPLLVAVLDLAVHSDPEDQEVRQLLLRRPPRVITRVQRSWEVSSIEFRERFEAICVTATEQKLNDRHIVLVLDNLDRLAADDALAAWSTLQALLPRQTDNIRAFRNLWVVVPFDPNALMKGGTLEDETVESAIDKTLATSFRVPPVIVPSWKNFTMKRLSQAMPDHKKEDLESAYRQLRTAMFSSDTHSLPSPRETITAINRIGALHRQWCDSIPLAEIAFFVGRCESKWASHGVDLEQLGALGSRAKWMMALWTGSDPGHAAYQLLGERVEGAFLSEKLESLRGLAKIAGSLDVAEEVFEGRMAEWREDPEVFRTIVRKTMDDRVSQWLSWQMWIEIAKAFSSISIDQFLDPRFSSDAAACLERMPDEARSVATSNVVSVLQNEAPKVEYEAERVPAWAEATAVLSDAQIVEESSGIAFQPASASAIALLLRNKPQALRSLDRESIVVGLVTKVESGSELLDEDPSWILEQLGMSQTELGSLLNSVDTGLRNASKLGQFGPRISIALAALDLLDDPHENPKLLASSLHCLAVSQQGESWKEVAGLVALALLVGHRRVGPEEAMGHTNNGHQALDRILEQPSRGHVLEHLRNPELRGQLVQISELAVDQPRFRNLIVEAVKGFDEDSWQRPPLSTRALRVLAPDLRKSLSPHQQTKLVATYASSGQDFLADLDLAKDNALIQMVQEMGSDVPCNPVTTLLQDAEEAEWLGLLDQGPEAVMATTSLAESCKILVATELGAALRSCLTAASAEGRTFDPESIQKLSSILHGSTLASVQRHGWELLSANPGNAGALLASFGQPLLAVSSLGAKLDILMADNAVAVLTSDDTDVLRWLVRALKSATLNKKAAEATRTVVTTQIQAGAADERLMLLEEIRDCLK